MIKLYMIKCLSCGGTLKHIGSAGVYKYFRCKKCRTLYALHKHTEEWIINKKEKWIDCTKELKDYRRVRVVFT